MVESAKPVVGRRQRKKPHEGGRADPTRRVTRARSPLGGRGPTKREEGCSGRRLGVRRSTQSTETQEPGPWEDDEGRASTEASPTPRGSQLQVLQHTQRARLYTPAPLHTPSPHVHMHMHTPHAQHVHVHVHVLRRRAHMHGGTGRLGRVWACRDAIGHILSASSWAGKSGSGWCE